MKLGGPLEGFGTLFLALLSAGLFVVWLRVELSSGLGMLGGTVVMARKSTLLSSKTEVQTRHSSCSDGLFFLPFSLHLLEA